jgi:adenylate cyclase class 2
MSIEHEAKFRLRDCLALEPALRAMGQVRTPWHFESNTVYDRAGELLGSGRLLRLRQALTSTLTFKARSPGPRTAGVKSRIEHECTLDDPLAMDAILRGLGYAPRLCYEKFRSEWALREGLVCLDILPFGHFLEIEAAPESMPGLALALGLDPSLALDETYHALHEKWRAQHGLEPMDSFVFDPSDRNRLTILLGCEARIHGDTHADRDPA